MPDLRNPFLGVHFTRRVNGDVWLGPNAVLAFAREGYRRLDINIGDLWETLRYPGFRKLALKYWRVGLEEMYRDFSKAGFLKALQRYMPELRPADLLPGPAGVRAQALASDGTLVDDFVVDQQDRALHVRNAPSPAATSSLAIAEMIVNTAPFDVTGHPAMNVPCAMSEGLPIGMMLVGRTGEDATVLRAADAFQRQVFSPPAPGSVRQREAVAV